MDTNNKELLIEKQQLRQYELNEGYSMILSISDAGSLFNLSEEDFLNYLMRLGIISVGYKQSQESIEKGWFLDGDLEPFDGDINKPDTFLSHTALKGIFSLLIDNNLIYYTEVVPKPFTPRRSEK
ncbi:hypothetical protein [Pontibacter pudoricolor]|uniref:hypothetical protein n=1 Tax=Pontibacter pudoricolor TaxID=2694930 RepID=UPI001391F22E|nr:hypothetical protein [Pontibacter pudoricolor]